MMSQLFPLIALAGAIGIGAMSPGPAFVFVMQTSISTTRREGLAAAAGMGFGAVVFAVLVMTGLQALVVEVTWAFMILKIAGGLYLIGLAVGLWRGAKQPVRLTVTANGARNVGAAFRRALLTQLSNPKTLVVYGGVFAALLPQDLPQWAAVGVPFMVLVIETSWYAFVALALSSSVPRRAYLRSKPVVDRIAAGALGLLGLRLLLMPARLR